MNGERLLLDTNAVIALLRGHQGLLDQTRQAKWLGVSVITVLEFLSFPKLSKADRQLLHAFTQRVDVVNLSKEDESLINAIAELRRVSRIKLPDAIIAASAIAHRASLVTADRGFPTVQNLQVTGY